MLQEWDSDWYQSSGKNSTGSLLLTIIAASCLQTSTTAEVVHATYASGTFLFRVAKEEVDGVRRAVIGETVPLLLGGSLESGVSWAYRS